MHITSISEASHRLRGHIRKTPIIEMEYFGLRLIFKCETLQRTGSFKIRGALNRLLKLSPTEQPGGVVAWSSGNHAQGVAAAAQQLNIPAVIVMPSDAPQLKVSNTRKLGAEVVLYDRATENRETIARKIAAERGCVVVPSYDDPDIIAGQGTVGLELADQARELGLTIDDVVVPASGGGLVAGVALAIHHTWPSARVYACEPSGYDDHVRSIAAGQRVANTTTAKALCDALLAATPGDLTWPINQQHLAGAYAVTDDDVCRAMHVAFTHLKLVVEPGGAVGLAAILSRKAEMAGRTVGVVLSGGNVDAPTFTTCLERGAALS